MHVVQPNETIGAIALLYGTTVDAIMKANNIADPRLIRAGQTLIIPLPTVTPTATASATPNATQAALPPSPTPNIYVVQGGDVLSAIAAKYNMPVDDIMAANGLKDTFLRAGQQLIIPPPTPTPTLTATPLPTSTPTPGLAFSAPALLFPSDGAEFGANDVVAMNWTAVGVLAGDQYYVLRLRTTDGKRVESLWLKTPSFRLPADWRGGQIEWDVIVLQLTKTNPDGTREGKIQSPFSATRRFAWS
jgi:LysM repeat protein